MIAFAELLERLVFTPSRNAKIALLRRYFATQPDPDRGIGLAAITGELSFTAAKPGLIRELAAARTDPVLFAWSYDYVGDLAETVALMWPAAPTNAAPPRLAEVVEALETRAEGCAAGHRRGLARCVRCVGAAGTSETDHRRVARRRLGAACEDRAGRDRRRRAGRCGGGVARPRAAVSAAVRVAGEARAAARSGAGAGVPPADAGASAGGRRTLPALQPRDWRAEWKWDGIRVQLVATEGGRRLYSRGADDISAAFPEIVEAMDFHAVLDGELLVDSRGQGRAVRGSAAAAEPQGGRAHA